MPTVGRIYQVYAESCLPAVEHKILKDILTDTGRISPGAADNQSDYRRSV